jgi:hypothetical protein
MIERLVTLTKDVDGNLVIKLTKSGKNKELKDYLLSLSDNDALSELLDYELCNGWDMIYPEEIGALTDAPILSDDAQYNDDGELIWCDNVYWYPDYQVLSPVEELFKYDQVVFQKGETWEEGE